MRRSAASLVILMALSLLQPVHGSEAPLVEDYWVSVEGEQAHGLVARPLGEPTAFVVILHGYTHQAESHRGHLEALAERGALAIAMDYRGPVEGFPLAHGAAETDAAIADLADGQDFPLKVLYSVSMGTAVAGMVLADTPGFFDYWVDNEGLAMLHETWAGASALVGTGNPTAVNAKAGIEAECGGTPADAPDAYVQRSAALRAPEFVGLKGAILVHGLNDGLVPHNQGREMQAALHAIGVPTDFYTTLRGHVGGEGTTLTGYAGGNVDGLSGHGTESDDFHTTTALSFALLYDLVEGDASVLPTGREVVTDRDLGTLP